MKQNGTSMSESQEQANEINVSKEEFSTLLEEYCKNNPFSEGKIVKAIISDISNGYVTVDAGFKFEGVIPVKEFVDAGEELDLNIGDSVEVYVERFENIAGDVVLSRARAKQEESLHELKDYYEKGLPVKGYVANRVKGGFIVNLSGAKAFLPGSHLDVRPLKDVSELMDKELSFVILRMDKLRGNIIVSRRAELEKTLGIEREEIVKEMHEGQVLEGIVKNITDYGAFIDLGGVDGLLHVIDMSWKRTKHPTEVFNVGDTVKVCITRINPENKRISLGMKQLIEDPWLKAVEELSIGSKVKGTVTNLTNYGAFVEIEQGVEGLIHISEMSWLKKNIQIDKLLSLGQEVEAVVLGIETEKRRISLGIKQCSENPWKTFIEKYPVNSEVVGIVKNITEFGLFVGLEDELDGMVHISDIDFNKTGEEALKEYRKGMEVRAIILAVDLEKERINLGFKQLTNDDTALAIAKFKKGDTVTCEIVEIDDNGISITLAGEVRSYIKRTDLGKDKAEQSTRRFAVGEKIDALVTSIDAKKKKVNLSIKALEIANEKEVLKQFGSTDSGASLGDILGEALQVHGKKNKSKTEEPSEE